MDFKKMTEDCDCQREQENNLCNGDRQRKGTLHCLEAPTDMSMNMMEVSKSAWAPHWKEFAGMALCASCHMYV